MTRLGLLLSAGIVVLTLIATASFYSRLPARIPMHWNIYGEVDGFGSRQMTFLVPAMMAGLIALFSVLPWLSPKQFEIDSFRATYWWIVLSVILFLAYVQGLMVFASLSGRVDIVRALLAGMLIMFGLMGSALTRVRRNFWVGVRTPWTLASERVWEVTHRIAARAFSSAACAGLGVLLLPLPGAAIFAVVMSLILAAALGPAIYSAVLYKQLQRSGQL